MILNIPWANLLFPRWTQLDTDQTGDLRQSLPSGGFDRSDLVLCDRPKYTKIGYEPNSSQLPFSARTFM